MENNKTLLERTTYSQRIISTLTKYSLVLGILTFVFGLLPLIWVVVFLPYSFFVIMLTITIVIGTVGLVFLVEDNIVSKLWSGVEHFSDSAPIFVNIQTTVAPILGGVALVISIISLILVISTKFRPNKGKDLAFTIIGLILALVGFFFGIVALSSN